MQPEKNISIEKFITDSGVDAVLASFQKAVEAREAENNPWVISDVWDAEGNQYVDLVQEGGGVWGIALLGYSYILEKAGIRFFSMAGTSAGAINTMLLATSGDRSEAKSEKVIQALLELDMFSFVDGKKDNWRFTRWVKKQVQKFVLNKDYVRNLIRTFLFILSCVSFFSVAACVTVLIGYNSVLPWFAGTALFFWMILCGVLFFIKRRVGSVIQSGYGLNEGNRFLNWMKAGLRQYGIEHLEDLKKHFTKLPAGLSLRPDAERSRVVGETAMPPDSPMLIIVASDITTGNKIEFPRMWDLYWENQQQVSPAEFVRASMSIPVFFEAYKIRVKNDLVSGKKIWKNHLNWSSEIPHQVSLVDGGVLSNFPINVFYNNNYPIPRMPTFGIRLTDVSKSGKYEINSLGKYISSIISTLRSTTDKDFLIKNKAFSLGVQTVDMSGYSWLNFFLTDADKKALFKKGAEAAVEFLLQFDWQEYKKQRLADFSVLHAQRENPNNW